MGPFMEHYPYGSHEDVMEILNRHPNATRQDVEKFLITNGPKYARRLPTPTILTFLEEFIERSSISREIEKKKGRKDVIAGPLLHVHSLHVQPKEALKGIPLLVCGTVRVKYENIITGEEVHLDVYRQSAKEPECISPSGGNLVLFRSDIIPHWIDGYHDLWFELHRTSIEVDLYQKIDEFTYPIARELFLVGSTTQGDVEELRSKEFQNALCSATLSYIKMPFGALYGVEFRFSSKNKGLVVHITGKVIARYKNTCGNYISEPCVLFENHNDFVPVKMKKVISRKVLGVPAYSSLEIELDLVDVNTGKPIKGKLNALNGDDVYGGYCVVDVDGDYAISMSVGLIPSYKRLSVHKNEPDDRWTLLNRYFIDPKCVLKPSTVAKFYSIFPDYRLKLSSIAEFYSIFIGRKEMGSALNIIGTVELSCDDTPHYLFKRAGDDGVEIEDSQKVLPLGGVQMRLDDYVRLELKVDLKDVGGKFQSRGFALLDRAFDTQICSVFPGEGGFCALHYSIFSRALLAKIEIFIKNKGDDFGSDIVYGSAIAYYSNFEYRTEFEKNYFRSVLFKKTEKDSVRLKDDGRVPLSRCVVAVPMGSSLCINVDLFGTHYHLSCNKVFMFGISSFYKLENDHDLDISLTWSDGFQDEWNESNKDKDCKMGQTKAREQPDQFNGGIDLDDEEERDCWMRVVEQAKTSTKRIRLDHQIITMGGAI